MTSEKIDLLIKALIKAKAQFGAVEKNRTNPYFKSKYADLGAVNDAVTGPLHDNGLTVMQTTAVRDDGTPVLVTTLAHESGQFISGQYPLLSAKNDPQGLGSALTYGRRYALSALLSVVADDDDDGNAAQDKAVSKAPVSATPKTNTTVATTAGGPVITEGQGRRLYAIWKNANRQDDEVRGYIKAKYGFNSTKEITKDTYEDIVKWVESKEPFPAADAEIEETPF